MAYTVKQLSELSGVTVRTLHYYEEADLLRPAYYGSNGYRYYEERQLLQLQQILFFKELGFSLKQIRNVLGRSDFDQLAALHMHRKNLMREWERMGQLIETVDKTIKHLKGEKKMNEQEMYGGFITKEKQEEYEVYLKNRFGEDHKAFKEGKDVKNWTKADWDKCKEETDSVMKELVRLAPQYAAGSPEVQKLIRKHFNLIKKFWTPDRESYPALGLMYTEFEWKKFFEAYDPHHPKLAKYLAEGMKLFAERELS